jgi:predicted nucleic acid-binding protein
VKAVLDTCVLFPTVMRAMLLGTARLGHYTPLWSARILEEWQRAAVKLGPTGPAQAAGEVALLRADWPKAELAASPGLEARLWLPDPNDIHVLASAVSGSADAIITLNAKDFPRGELAAQGLARIDPDRFLYEFWLSDPSGLQAVGQSVLDEANRLSGDCWDMRGLMKKARLPRLGKALAKGG